VKLPKSHGRHLDFKKKSNTRKLYWSTGKGSHSRIESKTLIDIMGVSRPPMGNFPSGEKKEKFPDLLSLVKREKGANTFI